MVQVDGPSRLAVRREAMNWLNRSVDSKGKKVNPVNVLFNDICSPLRCPQWRLYPHSFSPPRRLQRWQF